MARKRADQNGDAYAPAVPDASSATLPPATTPDEPAYDPNRPAQIVRFGPVRACVWLNETDQGPRYNVTVNRLYKGLDDQWHTTDGFGYNHLLSLAKALDQAHSWIAGQYAASEVPF